jgi:hypothetical protein
MLAIGARKIVRFVFCVPGMDFGGINATKMRSEQR